MDHLPITHHDCITPNEKNQLAEISTSLNSKIICNRKIHLIYPTNNSKDLKIFVFVYTNILSISFPIKGNIPQQIKNPIPINPIIINLTNIVQDVKTTFFIPIA